MWSLVTGGAKGLGASLVLALAARGHNVVIHYRTSKKEALEIKRQCEELSVRAEILEGDFETAASTEKFIAAYLERFHKTHTLIHNVGNFLSKPLLQTEPFQFQELLQNNVIAPFHLTKAFLPTLKGAIIHLGVAGLSKTSRTASAYHIAKTTLLALTKTLALECAPLGLPVNMVSPGYIEDSAVVPSQFPMGRPAHKEEIVRAILFLLDNPYITGQNLEVSGGALL